MSIDAEVQQYLDNTEGRYGQGTPLYFGRRALEIALESFKKGNYGIGAVVVVRRGDTIHEYDGPNEMLTGNGVTAHAETSALIRVAEGQGSDRHYPAGPDAVLQRDGGVVFGTLEPCPMCASVMTNGGVLRSFSTVADGQLVTDPQGYRVSDGGATVLGDKFPAQPQVWQMIQQGRGLSFELLDTSADPDLRALSEQIFTQTRAAIDAELATRKPPIH